jgi:hypothetical protein
LQSRSFFLFFIFFPWSGSDLTTEKDEEKDEEEERKEGRNKP